MEKILITLMERLRSEVPELTLVDEDSGQLEAEDSYPVTFPCALLSITQVQWSTQAEELQLGTVDLHVRLAIDTDYSPSTGRWKEVDERLRLVEQVNRVIISPSGSKKMRFRCPPERKLTRSLPLGGGVRLYETLYQFGIEDDRQRDTVPA